MSIGKVLLAKVNWSSAETSWVGSKDNILDNQRRKSKYDCRKQDGGWLDSLTAMLTKEVNEYSVLMLWSHACMGY